MLIGILGGYPVDFQRLGRPPPGITLRHLDRERAHLSIPRTVDAVLVVTKFVNHKHWQQLRASGVRIVAVEGGWSMVKRAIRVLADEHQSHTGVDNHE